MCTNICIPINVYYKCPMICFFSQIISRINIKSKFILIIFQRLLNNGVESKILSKIHNKFLTFLLLLYFHNQRLTFLFQVNMFPNKLAPKVPNKIPENPPFCSFVSFLVVLVNSLESSRMDNFNFHYDIHFFI